MVEESLFLTDMFVFVDKTGQIIITFCVKLWLQPAWKACNRSLSACKRISAISCISASGLLDVKCENSARNMYWRYFLRLFCFNQV